MRATLRGTAQALRFGGTLSEPSFAFLLNTPAVVLILVVVAYPIGYSFWTSLHRWIFGRPGFTFIGLNNYIALINSTEFWQAMWVTVIFSFFSVALIVILGTAAALVINEPFRGRGVVRSLVMIPWAIPGVVNGIMWKWILNSKIGALNGLLFTWGLIDHYQAWMLNQASALFMLVMAQVWNQLPFAIIVLLAGLQAIPAELYDAAQVDRAGPIQRFRNVTLPWLVHPLLIVIILETLVGLNTFDLIYSLTGGGPGNATTSAAWRVYFISFKVGDFGLGDAYAFIMALFGLVLAVLYLKALYSKGELKV